MTSLLPVKYPYTQLTVARPPVQLDILTACTRPEHWRRTRNHCTPYPTGCCGTPPHVHCWDWCHLQDGRQDLGGGKEERDGFAHLQQCEAFFNAKKATSTECTRESSSVQNTWLPLVAVAMETDGQMHLNCGTMRMSKRNERHVKMEYHLLVVMGKSGSSK